MPDGSALALRLGMPIAGVKDLTRLLVVGSFLRRMLRHRWRAACASRKERPARQRHSARTPKMVAPGAQTARWSRLRRWWATLGYGRGRGWRAEERRGQSRLLGKPPEIVSDEALAIAQSLASGRKVAVWLGNPAVQHARASGSCRCRAVDRAPTGRCFGFHRRGCQQRRRLSCRYGSRRGWPERRRDDRSSHAAYVTLNLSPISTLPTGGGDGCASTGPPVAAPSFDSPSLRQG